MSRGSQVHIFWGAPVPPLKTTVSQETTSLISTANAWEKVRLFYKQHSLYLKAGNQEFKNLEDCQVPEGLGPPGLFSGHLLTTSLSGSAQAGEGFKHSASEAQSVKSQVIPSDVTSVPICGLKDGVQRLPEEENYQRLQCENKKIIDEQLKNQSDPSVWNFYRYLCQLDDVAVYEDRWVGETVLQSTFTSQLLNLGSYSYVQPEKYSNVIASVMLQDLLAYVSSKHPYLKELPQRQPQKMDTVEFVELKQLQPDTLVHAVLRVVDVTVLTEALYSYRGQKQRKVVLTVEQAQGQHYVLILWGPAAAWYTQLQRKKDCIWEFKYLFVQRNCILENLELHTTLWSSCECLFDDDTRAISFKAKFQKNTSSFVNISDLATHLKDKYSGVVLIKAKVSELVFSAAAARMIALNAHSTLKSIFSSLPNITYAGCAHCGSELETDDNRIYRQCLSCLPLAGKKTFYRPALMTIVDGRHNTCVHVGSKMMEQILLNISPDCLNRVIVPSSEVTFGMVAADLLHSLLAVRAEPCVLKIQSLFELDENSYPLQQNFSLLDFCPDSCKLWSPGLSLRPEEDTGDIPRKE
ncbi:shieldin complex subunit 2 isoform X2 [Arvicanthis niloticus]|uniref:shieldin complex subunit 2 isoform X2 n=1 Tax=Arvicanthis niloticus TaxID=61156 RepID=UPI00402B08D9